MTLYGPNAIPVRIMDFIQTFEDIIAFPGWIAVLELILLDQRLYRSARTIFETNGLP